MALRDHCCSPILTPAHHLSVQIMPWGKLLPLHANLKEFKRTYYHGCSVSQSLTVFLNLSTWYLLSPTDTSSFIIHFLADVLVGCLCVCVHIHPSNHPFTHPFHSIQPINLLLFFFPFHKINTHTDWKTILISVDIKMKKYPKRWIHWETKTWEMAEIERVFSL